MSSPLDEVIKSADVVALGTTRCPYCIRVKKFFDEQKIAYKYVNIDDLGAAGDALQREVEAKYKHETVPAVFIKGNFVGGCDDTLALHKKGKLTAMWKR